MERNPFTTIPQPKHNKVNFQIEKKKLVSNLLMMSLHNSLKKNSDRQELMFAD
jgi:hypothetical protein